MIRSSIEDNWMRVSIMHAVVQEHYDSTKHSDFRERMLTGGSPFPFDVLQYDSMEIESALVGMLMAWSVVAIESIVNHALAESISHESMAIMAIEYPRLVIDKLKIAKGKKSELAAKLAILSSGSSDVENYLSLCDELSELRNRVVHDKPFSLIQQDDGTVEAVYFSARGEPLERNVTYNELTDFFEKCEKVKDYVFSLAEFESVSTERISFTGLHNG